ncbi:MAG: 5'-methylthioadenosine/S-adenosylhomocysteine nucleosidase [Clostridia bacterium]|nr:5'-methylthioadenosine/S-adenosylhomocysteine nucleosidase [Clostridia bacterium]
MTKVAGLIFADSMEYSPFLLWAKEKGGIESVRHGNESVEFTFTEGENTLKVVGVKCGIGKSNAASATAFLIADDKADFILNAGLSGAIQGLRREDMVAGTTYIECDFDLTAVGNALGQKADGQKYLYEADAKLLAYALESEGIKKAKCGTGDIFLADPVKKELYKNTFGIESFDMETGAIAAVCDKCGVPMLSLRKISDDAGDTACEAYREMNKRQEACLTELVANILARYLSDKENF